MIKTKVNKLSFFVFFLSFVFCLLPSVSYSETQLTLNLSGLIQEAFKNNPELKAFHKRYEAALARVKLLRSLEDPWFEYEYDKITADMDSVMRGKTSPMRTFSISQEIPFPSKLFLRKQAAEQEAKSLKEEYKEKENEIIQKVKEQYYMLSLTNKKIQITEDTSVLLDQLIKTLTNRYSIGKASQQDVLRAQTEYAKLDNEIILLRQKKRVTQSMLKALLNRPQDAELMEPPIELKDNNVQIDRLKLFAMMKENRPELKSFREMVDKSKTEYNMAKQEYLPDFMFKYKREERNNSSGDWAGMVGVTLPIWFWEKQDSFVKETKAQLEEMQSAYQQLENMVSYELESALINIDSKKRLVKLYETSFLPQAEAAFKAASVGFEAGRNDFLDFLDSERMLFEFKLDYAMVVVDLEIAYADLERAVGVELE